MIWKGNECFLGIPMPFTKYTLTSDCLDIVTGIFSVKIKRIKLYRVKDISFSQSLFGKMLNVGEIFLETSDANEKNVRMKNIKNPHKVFEMLDRFVDNSRYDQGVRITEFVSDNQDCI